MRFETYELDGFGLVDSKMARGLLKTKNDQRSGLLNTSTMNNNIEKVHNILSKDNKELELLNFMKFYPILHVQPEHHAQGS